MLKVMLNHTAKDRPPAAEIQRYYKGYVAHYKMFEGFSVDSLFKRMNEEMLGLGIKSKPVMRRNRTVIRSTFNRHRNAK